MDSPTFPEEAAAAPSRSAPADRIATLATTMRRVLIAEPVRRPDRAHRLIQGPGRPTAVSSPALGSKTRPGSSRAAATPLSVAADVAGVAKTSETPQSAAAHAACGARRAR